MRGVRRSSSPIVTLYRHPVNALYFLKNMLPVTIVTMISCSMESTL